MEMHDFSRYVGLDAEPGALPVHPDRCRKVSRTEQWVSVDHLPALGKVHRTTVVVASPRSNLLRRISEHRLALEVKTGLRTEGGGVLGHEPKYQRLSRQRSRLKVDPGRPTASRYTGSTSHTVGATADAASLGDFSENNDNLSSGWGDISVSDNRNQSYIDSQPGSEDISQYGKPDGCGQSVSTCTGPSDVLEHDTPKYKQAVEEVLKQRQRDLESVQQELCFDESKSSTEEEGNFGNDVSCESDKNAALVAKRCDSRRLPHRRIRSDLSGIFAQLPVIHSARLTPSSSEWQLRRRQFLVLATQKASLKRSTQTTASEDTTRDKMELLRRVNGATRTDNYLRPENPIRKVSTHTDNYLRPENAIRKASTHSRRRSALDDITEDREGLPPKESDDSSHGSSLRALRGRQMQIGEVPIPSRLTQRRGSRAHPNKLSQTFPKGRSNSVNVEIRRQSDVPTPARDPRDKSRRGTWTYDTDGGVSNSRRFRRKGQAHKLFRSSARKIMIVLQWMKVLSKQDERIETQLKTFFDIAQELDHDNAPKRSIQDEAGLAFDPRYYKAKRAIHLTGEQKRILTLHNDFRTADNIQKVIAGLHHLEAFAEYPLHMQEKLAKVAWYQELPAKKMIIRQGHKAENFYFILSGSALAKQLVRDEATGNVIMRVVARMQRGESFGEVALVQHSERTATVESVTSMQLLVVSREDFMDIFFSSGGEGSEPDHISFCRTIHFLQEWPIEKCLEEPRSCLFHYFRRGTVIVADSRNNEWIYIVKTGTCTVLKKLRSVTANRSNHNRLFDVTLKLPRDGTSIPGPRVDSRGPMTPSTPIQHPSSATPSSARLPHSDGSLSSRSNVLLPAISKNPPTLVYDKATSSRSRSQTKHTVTFLEPEDVSPERDRSRSPDKSSSSNSGRPPSPPTSAKSVTLPITDSTNNTGYRTSYSRSKFKKFPKVMAAYIRSVEALIGNPRYGMGNFADTPRSPTRESSALEKDPCFVQLKKLRPRDVFGLEEAVYEDEAMKAAGDPESSVTLVSNGAELIMLSRRFFLKHANATVRKNIREMVHPFPTEDTLQDNLQTKLDWDLYRKDMVNDLVTMKSEEKILQMVC